MKKKRIKPRLYKGFRDIFGEDVEGRRAMLEKIRQVYDLYGFSPLETPAVEFVDILGKFLPESNTPDGGIFSWQNENKEWVALRYDLTASLSRVVSQYCNELPFPFRRYQAGKVWRFEKPGPGRFREFYQFDIDTVGSASMLADTEICTALCDSFEKIGIKRGDYIIRINNRKVLNGILELIGLEWGSPDGRWLAVLRTIDKLDRLGIKGVEQLLGTGRKDQSGDYLSGAELDDSQIEKVIGFLNSFDSDRTVLCDRLEEQVKDSKQGMAGVEELRQINTFLSAGDVGIDRVLFDSRIVRGLAYYTGPVFEAELTFDIVDKKGRKKPFGSVAGGGRYDELTERFLGRNMPATGASIGVDRLLAALKYLDKNPSKPGPVIVVVLDKNKIAEYQKIVMELRAAGIASEIYLGKKGFGQQLKYADKRNSPVAVIAGGDEFDRGEVSLKNLWLGKELSGSITSRDEWRKGQPAQFSVKRELMIASVLNILEPK